MFYRARCRNCPELDVSTFDRVAWLKTWRAHTAACGDVVEVWCYERSLVRNLSAV